MNNRVMQNPAYGYGGSNFGFVTVTPSSAAAMVTTFAVVGGLASAVFIGSDVAKTSRLRAMLSPREARHGCYRWTGAALLALGLYAFQQG